MRADGLPYIPPCPVCDTDTPRFLTVGLVSWAIKCRDKDCGFKLKHEQESVLRDLWARLQPAEVDPIAELEAMGGFLSASGSGDHNVSWMLDDDRRLFVEEIPFPELPRRGLKSSDIRAAAARLLERVKGRAK